MSIERTAEVKAADGRYVDPVIEAYKKDVDRTLIRHMLGLTVEERLVTLEQSLRNVADLRRAAIAAAAKP